MLAALQDGASPAIFQRGRSVRIGPESPEAEEQ